MTGGIAATCSKELATGSALEPVALARHRGVVGARAAVDVDDLPGVGEVLAERPVLEPVHAECVAVVGRRGGVGLPPQRDLVVLVGEDPELGRSTQAVE